MILKNNSKRLITINSKMNITKHPTTKQVLGATPGKFYNLMPAGPAVEVPDEMCDTRYVKVLIASGDITAKVEVDEDETESSSGLMELQKETLVELATEIGVDVHARWNKSEIVTAIEAKQAETIS